MINAASGSGAGLIFDGTPWAFRLQETKASAGRKIEFRVHVTEGSPPLGAGWGNFALSVMGWSQYPWCGGVRLPPWSSEVEPLYEKEIQRHLAELGAPGKLYGLRLEGLLNETHMLCLHWVPDAIDQTLSNMLIIGLQPVSGAPATAVRASDGTAHGDPR
ncbi:MAG: hypothetical protein DIU71_13570 [Proteobacteria bacterium]|nr:MAG: hypothetical protein DIU71_13570 [Pseudomonadota bacterium]